MSKRPDSLIVAHRGASGERAEHTLAAYELAIEQGADGLECDIRLTKDGHFVCIHDRTIERTSDGTGVVSEMTLDELREYDFGSWHTSSDGIRRPSPVLELSTLLDVVTSYDREVPLFIETKHPVRYGAMVERNLVAMLHRRRLARPRTPDDSLIKMISFSPTACWRMRRHSNVPTYLLGETSRLLRGTAAKAFGATGIGPSVSSLLERPDTVRNFQPHNIYCWTVDDLDEQRACQAMGIGWIAVNWPAKAVANLR